MATRPTLAAVKNPKACSIRAANICQAAEVERIFGAPLPPGVEITQILPLDRSCALANDAHPFARCLLDNPDYETDDGLKLAPVYGTNSL